MHASDMDCGTRAEVTCPLGGRAAVATAARAPGALAGGAGTAWMFMCARFWATVVADEGGDAIGPWVDWQANLPHGGCGAGVEEQASRLPLAA